MAGIFINYRGIERSWAPMFLDLGLSRRFGRDNVFQAGRSIPSASDIRYEIPEALRRSTVLIALIDKAWLKDIDELRKPDDWVRMEIAYALEHGKHVQPVLLDGADMPKSHQLPTELSSLKSKMAISMSTRSAYTDLPRLVGEMERLAPDLVLASLTDMAPPPPVGPATLLRAEYEAFPLRHRPEADELNAWHRDPRGARVRLLTAPMGAGKTRLALHLCALVRSGGLPAGLVSPSAPAAALDPLGEITTRSLVVIDDAEIRPAQVTAALRALAEAPTAPGRVLLLARSATEWLDRLREDRDDRMTHLIDEVVHMRLPHLPVTDADFDTACTAFAARLRREIPPMPSPQTPATTILEVQAAALSHLTGPADPAQPLARILHLERDHWRRTAAEFGLPDLGRRNIAEIMAAVSLFGADTESSADRLLSTLGTFQGGPVRAIDACRDMLRTLLPGTAALNQVQPDQLAEDIIADYLHTHTLSGAFNAVGDAQAHRALVILGRCLARYPALKEPVAAQLTEAPGRFLPLAMTALASIPLPHELAELMCRVIDTVPTAALEELVNNLPQRSESLAKFAVAVTERTLTIRLAEGAHTEALARLSRLHAMRLLYAGERTADAIDAARSAVARLTTPTGAPAPDSTPDPRSAELCEALATFALALDADPGAAEQALAAGEQAIAGYQALQRGNRRDAALAQALHHHSFRLGKAGRPEAAMSAAAAAHELTRPLDAEKPGRFGSLHTDVMDNLAVRTARSGRPDLAEALARRTLVRRRTLAQARPDAYRPQLAGTLFNLGLILSIHDTSWTEVRALWTDSLTILDELAIHRPGRFDELRARVHRHLGDLGDGP